MKRTGNRTHLKVKVGYTRCSWSQVSANSDYKQPTPDICLLGALWREVNMELTGLVMMKRPVLEYLKCYIKCSAKCVNPLVARSHIAFILHAWNSTGCLFNQQWNQDPAGHPITKQHDVLSSYRQVSQSFVARDIELEWSDRFEIWQLSRQHSCRSACQNSERDDYLNIHFRNANLRKILYNRSQR